MQEYSSYGILQTSQNPEQRVSQQLPGLFTKLCSIVERCQQWIDVGLFTTGAFLRRVLSGFDDRSIRGASEPAVNSSTQCLGVCSASQLCYRAFIMSPNWLKMYLAFLPSGTPS
ncbi:hypothetical protein STEG23_001159, partial [Scotinomys teguina]